MTVPLPEPTTKGKWDYFSKTQMLEYAAAVSAADNAALRADNTALQNDVIGPLRERVRVLEAALDQCLDDMGEGHSVCEAAKQCARAALGEKL